MRSLRQQISEKCIHFTGVQHEKCKAGIVYKSLQGPLPCFRGDIAERVLSGRPPSQCDKVEWPTEEAIAAEIEMWRQEFEKTRKGLQAVEHIRAEHKGKNWRGVIECPICQGKLHVSHASNNHVHARCETPDCLAWME